jgi:hypothetical protein
MLPDPSFITRYFVTEEEVAAFMDGKRGLVAYHLEGEGSVWRVTTSANFESDEYWHGRPEEGGSISEVLRGE